MNRTNLDRRDFLQQASSGAAGLSLAMSPLFVAKSSAAAERATLAALGGEPIRKRGAFHPWPVIAKNDRDAWQKVLEEGKWCRLDGKYANQFEQAYAERTGTKRCVATANGTSALYTSLNALGVGPGDEVLVPPYTFVATINVVLLQYALPVFIDTDRQSSQMDATKIEAAITPRTTCIIPVHLGGNPCDMDAILAVGKKHSIPVVEDACQAHFGEWRGQKLGSLGATGCFSFQATKNLNCGEGGAIITNDEALAGKCYAFHNNGRGRAGAGFSYPVGGANLRMTEFQAALLLTQMTRVEEESRIREENAKYLTKQLQEIPGITVAKEYAGCTRNAYHIYMFRYSPEGFAGATRRQFMTALNAEGIPCSGGYGPLNKQQFLKETLQSKAYKAIFGEQRLSAYWNTNHCPENDKLCQEALWMGQTTLLGSRPDMDQIVAAIRKVQANAGELHKIS